MEVSTIRQRLQSASGRQFWRTLEELAESPELADELRAEFPKATFIPGAARPEWIKELRSSAVEDPLIARLPDSVRRDAFRVRALSRLRGRHRSERSAPPG